MTQFTHAEKIANCKACTLAQAMKVCPLCQFYTVQNNQAKTQVLKPQGVKFSNPALSTP